MQAPFRDRLGNYTDRTLAITKASLTTNALIGVGKLLLGFSLFSLWFIMNAFYYLLLCCARLFFLRQYAYAVKMRDATERYDWEFGVFRYTGLFLSLMGVAYFFICLKMYVDGDSTVYRGYIVYLVAFISFIKLGFAIYGTVVTRRMKSPIILALKIVSFADAMVSIVVTQCTLLTHQGSPYAVSSSALFGAALSMVFLLVGIGMFAKRKTARGANSDKTVQAARQRTRRAFSSNHKRKKFPGTGIPQKTGKESER